MTYPVEQQRRMLAIARAALEQVLLGIDPPIPAIGGDEKCLSEPRGCFVTLHHRHGRLRGCIGTFEAVRSLIENIVHMTAAATRDPRFVYNDPVVLAEINDLLLEISVLTPMQKIDDPRRLRLGVDGVYIKALPNGRPVTGCFLPQVAGEQGWNVEQTLSACCSHKMGLAADAWKSPASGMEFFVFQSDIVAEHGSPTG
jgi:AmmeMemoRadiSam system protein A